MMRRTSSRETWRHDSRIRPHFGHFTIHWSRSSLPTLVPPRHLARSRPDRCGDAEIRGAISTSPGRAVIASESRNPAASSAALSRTALASRISGDRCGARNRRSPLASSPRRELAGHLHREVEVVDRDLLDVHAERDRRMRLGGGCVKMRPQRVGHVQRRTSGRATGGREERLLRPRRYRGPEPHEEFDVLVVRDGREAQEYGRRLQVLGRAPPPICPEDRRHRLRFEEHLRREEIAARPRLLNESIDLVIAFRDRDVPEGDVVTPLRRGPQDTVGFDDRRAGISNAAAVPPDEHKVSEAVSLQRFLDPTSKDGLGRNVGDDLVHDRVDPEVSQEGREVARIQIAIERLTGVILLEDLWNVHCVEVLQRTDRVTNPLDERVHGLLAHPPSGRDDFEDHRRRGECLSEGPRHAGPHGSAELLERSWQSSSSRNVSPRRNEKHNVSPAIVRIEAKGWAIASGGGPCPSRCMTSRCATPPRTSSRRSANGWGWRSASTRCSGFRRISRASDATRPRWSSRASDRRGRNIAATSPPR